MDNEYVHLIDPVPSAQGTLSLCCNAQGRARRTSASRSPSCSWGTHRLYLLMTTAAAPSSAPILCVCLTNHALDSFLEELLDAGITDIVRAGSR